MEKLLITVVALSFLLVLIGIVIVIKPNGNLKKGLSYSVLGAIIYCICSFIQIDTSKNNEITLINQMAAMLETTPDKLVIEDMSETQALFFPHTTNSNLREVHYDGKIYVAEIQDSKVKKLIKSENK